MNGITDAIVISNLKQFTEIHTTMPRHGGIVFHFCEAPELMIGTAELVRNGTLRAHCIVVKEFQQSLSKEGQAAAQQLISAVRNSEGSVFSLSEKRNYQGIEGVRRMLFPGRGGLETE